MTNSCVQVFKSLVRPAKLRIDTTRLKPDKNKAWLRTTQNFFGKRKLFENEKIFFPINVTYIIT